jgi:hypothetical protein
MLKIGARLRSSVCTTEVVVVRPPQTLDVVLDCGGRPMAAADGLNGAGRDPDPSFAQGTLLGKRYVHEPSGLEVLCTKPGLGSLSVERNALTVKGAKPLPSAD